MLWIDMVKLLVYVYKYKVFIKIRLLLLVKLYNKDTLHLSTFLKFEPNIISHLVFCIKILDFWH